MAGVLRTIFQITYTMHYVFIAEVLQRVLTTGLMAAIIFMGTRLSTDIRTYELFLWVGSAGAILLFTLSVIFALRQMPMRLTFDGALLLRLLKQAMPYGIAFLCIALYRQFDPSLISFETILDVFFATHDPTTPNQQGNDHGTQYRSAIFYHSPEQKETAEKKIRELTENHTYSNSIVTEITQFTAFYPAEDYHQNFYNRNKDYPYCKFIIDPKIKKLIHSFSDKLKE
jgi:hypothetical protein